MSNLIHLSETPEAFCENGLPGVQRFDVCCEARCGTCGGEGCGERAGRAVGSIAPPPICGTPRTWYNVISLSSSTFTQEVVG